MELWGNGVMNSLAQHSNTPSLQYFLDATFRGKRGWSDLTEEAKKQLQKWMQQYAAPECGRCPPAAGHLW